MVTVGFDFSAAAGFGTLGLGGHVSGVLAFDPQGNVAVVGTAGVGGGFGAGAAAGVTFGYIPGATSVFTLGTSSTITSTVGGGDGIGGSVLTDLEGNTSLTVGTAVGVQTSATVDFSGAKVVVCHQ